jgi:hypothetical protein
MNDRVVSRAVSKIATPKNGTASPAFHFVCNEESGAICGVFIIPRKRDKKSPDVTKNLSRLRKNKKGVIARSLRTLQLWVGRRRSNLVLHWHTNHQFHWARLFVERLLGDCFVASLLAMTKSDFFRTLLEIRRGKLPPAIPSPEMVFRRCWCQLP